LYGDCRGHKIDGVKEGGREGVCTRARVRAGARVSEKELVCVCVCVCVCLCVCVGEEGEKDWFQTFFQQQLPYPLFIVFSSLSRSLSLSQICSFCSLYCIFSLTHSLNLSCSLLVWLSVCLSLPFSLFSPDSELNDNTGKTKEV